MLDGMKTQKPTKPFVVLFAVIIIGLLWWHGRSDHRDELANASATPVSPSSDRVAEPVEQAVVEGAVGNDSPGVALSDDAAEMVVVEGQLNDRQALGIGGMQIELSSKGTAASMRQVFTTSSDPSGHFLFESVPLDSDYRLEVLASGAYAGTLVDPYPVGRNRSAESITLESVELASVDGMFVDANRAPVAGFQILVQNVGMAYPGRNISSDSSGFFELKQFPAGSLQFSASGNENFHVTGVELKPDEYHNLEIVVDKGSYLLSGQVRDEFDNPISQARVVLTSDYSQADYRSTSYRLDVTDIDGSFSFAGLGGLQHRILVDAVGYENHTLDHQFRFSTDHINIRMQKR